MLRGGVVVPDDALAWRFSRSSGPGGQSVNTTDSRVELTVDLARIAWTSPTQQDRVLARLAARLRGSLLTVSAQEYRSQLRNREAALTRVHALLDDALAPPGPTRRATRPSRGSQVRRVQGEQKRRAVKELRRRRWPPAGADLRRAALSGPASPRGPRRGPAAATAAPRRRRRSTTGPRRPGSGCSGRRRAWSAGRGAPRRRLRRVGRRDHQVAGVDGAAPGVQQLRGADAVGLPVGRPRRPPAPTPAGSRSGPRARREVRRRRPRRHPAAHDGQHGAVGGVRGVRTRKPVVPSCARPVTSSWPSASYVPVTTTLRPTRSPVNVVCGTSTSSRGTAGAATSSAVCRSAAAAPCTCARSSCQAPSRAHSAAAASSRTSSSEHPGPDRGPEHRRRRAALGLLPGPTPRAHADPAGAGRRARRLRGSARSRLTVPRGTRPPGPRPDPCEPPTTPLTCAATLGEAHRTFGVRSPTPPAPTRGVRLYDKWARDRTKDPRPQRAPDGRLAPRRWQTGSTTGERDEHDDVGTQHVADRERHGGRRRDRGPASTSGGGPPTTCRSARSTSWTTRCCASRSRATTSSRGCSATGAPRPA